MNFWKSSLIGFIQLVYLWNKKELVFSFLLNIKNFCEKFVRKVNKTHFFYPMNFVFLIFILKCQKKFMFHVFHKWIAVSLKYKKMVISYLMRFLRECVCVFVCTLALCMGKWKKLRFKLYIFESLQGYVVE